MSGSFIVPGDGERLICPPPLGGIATTRRAHRARRLAPTQKHVGELTAARGEVTDRGASRLA